ncbi:hypothetical protein [Pedobacter aquatilis]|uniref:hypothetical protein n=1 Tax=Pedobacter aquatilis TaxID=351343 RepID=UPI00292CF4B6|nr:hypothetical protein [Pedobacter aquatilis]
MLKQYVFALTLLFAITIIIYSCKKENNKNVETAELSNWYNNQTRQVRSIFSEMKPNWNKTYLIENDSLRIYELELDNPKNIFQVKGTLEKNTEDKVRTFNKIKLLIFKDKRNNNIYSAYMSITNDVSQQEFDNIHYTQVKNLSGEVLFFNLKGSFVNGWQYNSGKIVKKISSGTQNKKIDIANLKLNQLNTLPGAKGLGRERLQLGGGQRCYEYLIAVYGQSCVGAGNYTQCEYYVRGWLPVVYCDPDPYAEYQDPETGECHWNSPPSTTDMGAFYDCNGDLNGGAYMAECGCVSGNTGIQSCAQKVDVDPDARECLKNIKAALESLGMKNTSKSAGLISNILNKLNLSTGSDFNAIITEGNLNSGIASTTFITNPNSWGSQGYVSKINFNSSFLNTASELSTVRTMIHEYLHSYFDWNLYLIRSGQKNADPDFEKVYTLLFDEGGTPIPDAYGNAAQHEQIARSFTSEISGMLKQYAIIQNISMPADPLYFDKMAWGGLQYTSLYKFAPTGTTYTNSAEQGNSSATITTALKCKTN